MKYLKNSFLFVAITFILLFASTAVFAENPVSEVIISEKDTIVNSVVCYEVLGMDCPGCQSALEKQVEKIEGVAEANASWKEKQVTIKLKPGAEVKEEDIKKRIEKANFTPGKKLEIKTDEQ